MVNRFPTFAKFALVALLFSGALSLALLIGFHGYLIDAIYKNVDDSDDGEMPTTVTSYPSGPEVVGIIGGSGEGLNCSLPPGFDAIFDAHPDSLGNRRLVRQRFRQACVFHDLCYRHGLATYGYSQNDCDRILQNQAFRLCKYIANKDRTSDAKRCQQDSKKVLAGVNLGGFNSYRAWDRSTFFEFDSYPIRSMEFSTSRVVDHPFKSIDPTKYRNDADQVLLTFTDTRSNLAVKCATCKSQEILEWSTDPANVSAELKSVGLNVRPEALVRGDLSLARSDPIWLPPRRAHAAPHLVVDGAGKHRLVWMSRVSMENTGSCIVFGDAARLLTYTLPKRDSCHVGARSQLNLVQAEMYASSPVPFVLPGERPGQDILATGLTAQLDGDRSLRLCLWSERIRAADAGGDEAVCRALDDKQVAAGKGLGAFQNFAVVRPGQQIFFTRDVILPPASNPFAGFLEHVKGNIYSPRGLAVVLKVDAPANPTDGPGVVAIQKIVPFVIDDRFDPMMPATTTMDDLRFLSLLATNTDLGVYQTDFRSNDPTPRKIGLAMNGTALNLDSSWGQRPTLIVEPKEAPRKTQLVFSRGHVYGTPDQLSDTVRLEVLVFERALSDPADKPFSVVNAGACTVTYRFEQTNSHRACLRAFEPDRPMRSSPAAMMRASPLLAGRLIGSKELGLAFADRCLDQDPIVLKPADVARRDFTVTTPIVEQGDVKREVDCVALNSPERIGLPMATSPLQ